MRLTHFLPIRPLAHSQVKYFLQLDLVTASLGEVTVDRTEEQREKERERRKERAQMFEKQLHASRG